MFYLKKILFLIHDLGQGGAEKVLVNLVNNMDYSKFDVTVMTLFDCGENRSFLNSQVKYKSWCSKMIPGNSHLMKLLSPEKLHKLIIKEKYDIEVAYLEGPCARIISGCENSDVKIVSWIHSTAHSLSEIAASFRSCDEAKRCYRKFDSIVYVSEDCLKAFQTYCKTEKENVVLYNTNNSEHIIESAKTIPNVPIKNECFNWCGIGKLVPLKGFDRMLGIQKRLIDDGLNTHLYILGEGSLKTELQEFCRVNKIENTVTFLGYQINPYQYIAKCDLFVCSSLSEGFSTAATEALIVGTPVCTVEVSGMREMLGDSEYGLITENSEEALYQGIRSLIDNPEKLVFYKKQAQLRGEDFSTEETVKSVEKMFMDLI